ncbi:MAG: DNA (cytosine-5-)-methyltransferase [Pseudomonas fluorescens]|uniref:DNA (cytosine-5-)-methyltransferase n=1 Tax=Agrobacterium pusense TaxID=648995 RepID=UPI000DB018F8|nr:DNA (cytosine-5-)-methyltransferase [Agrobacterium pusense]MDH1271211.1 DNA (cytosine-5-)-methyltransferase [Agrobacterium pusense]PZP39352.1 MAG: DNA (cytosine-5-)-methyltransferase [Pseudomonas fluorescens]
MTPQDKSEFTRLREQAGLTIEEAAKVIKVSLRSAYRHENGECSPSPLALDMLRLLAHSHRPPERPSRFRFIDLFAGIGGLRVGFENIGGKCVFTSEWDKYASETYRKNFPEDGEHVFAGDIREYTKDEAALARIPAHDVLLAGFPCQPFSIAGVSKKNALGRPHGFLDATQGTLFFDVAQIIRHHRPKAFLLENVKNLQRHDKGRTFATIMNVLEKELGYKVVTRIVSARPWVPQGRDRIFIAGFRDHETAFSFDDVVIPAGPEPTLGSILEAQVADKYTLTPKLWDYLQAYKKKHESKGNGFGFGLFGPGDVARTLSARYYKDGSEILINQGKGNRPRRLTPKECARLMGFERGNRSWNIPVSDTQAYKQFGNAVVMPVVEAIAEAMSPWLPAATGEVVPFPASAGEPLKAVVHG